MDGGNVSNNGNEDIIERMHCNVEGCFAIAVMAL